MFICVLRHLRALAAIIGADVQPIHRTAVALLAVAACGAALLAQQPTFRSDIDSVQLDVRVIDEEGRFVGDLTRGDLEVFEDGQPQNVSTFAMVDIPVAGDAGRSRAVPSDVATNAGANQGRLFVLVLDDLNTHPLRAITVRQLAKYFVDHNLEEADRLAIVTTGGSRSVSHEFTASRERLHAVIDRFAGHSLQPADVVRLQAGVSRRAVDASLAESRCLVARRADRPAKGDRPHQRRRQVRRHERDPQSGGGHELGRVDDGQ